MKLNFKLTLILILGLVGLSSFLLMRPKPVIYIIGDSTVRNGNGTGANGLWGWGDFLADHLDSSKVSVVNKALGGRSSRTFITEGHWDQLLPMIKAGDYVLIQFGHNDASPLDDTARARGTINGIGDEEKEIYNPIMKKQELVHTYGWYLRKYLDEIQKKGAIPVVFSPVPRDNWKNGKLNRIADTYGGWAREVAKSRGAFFIDLNELVAAEYEKMGEEAAHAFFPGDHTHTNKAGAQLTAAIVAKALTALNDNRWKEWYRN